MTNATADIDRHHYCRSTRLIARQNRRELHRAKIGLAILAQSATA